MFSPNKYMSVKNKILCLEIALKPKRQQKSPKDAGYVHDTCTHIHYVLLSELLSLKFFVQDDNEEAIH